ncbi:hypothetical protein [Chitinophaga sp.]|uniref:hypothetical protein n=1 Tax=Chitinophaga sp. TaxID=1869181 RepID=UPI002C6CEAA2|nr:hypothetical protein [Chitinophaga sp.]HWV66614.1 hypothetical protein [Chitinophaga sp.]
MHANIFSITYLVANMVSLIVLIAAISRAAVARVMLSMIFIGAGLFNGVMAIRDPNLFMAYGAMTPLRVYEQFIYGAFRNNITAIVISISICQLAAGIFIAATRTFMITGLTAAIIFLVAIAPLGAGSAFPSTLLLAAAAAILLFKETAFTVFPLWTNLSHLFSHKKNEV